MLVPLDHKGVIGCMYFGRKAIDTRNWEQLARKFGHEHHHGRVLRELLGVQLLPDNCPNLGEVTGGRGCALEANVSPHVSEDLRGGILGAPASPSSCASSLSVTHARPTCRATASGVGERSGWGSAVDPCLILRSGTSTRSIPWQYVRWSSKTP